MNWGRKPDDTSESDFQASEKQRRFLIALLVTLGLSFLLAGIITFVEGDKPSEVSAIFAAQEAVKAKLYAPATARFSDIEYLPRNDGTWIVRGYVDAHNLFGALIRKRFYCTLRYIGNDKWEVVEVFIFDG